MNFQLIELKGHFFGGDWHPQDGKLGFFLISGQTSVETID